jgi:acetylornithine deacetylase
MSVKETLAQLVSIDSVSSRSNARIISYLEDCCQALGFSTARHPYKDEAGVEKVNLVCRAGINPAAPDAVELVLVGHTDTVPYDPNWTGATRLIEQNGNLFGRGACDTKGYIAAALTAVETVGIARLQRPLALVFTADEEVGLMGAKRLVDQKPFRARYSIVGEPTSLKPIHAGKGYCLAEIVVRGREGHSAYPALGKSAIFGAARLISRIETIVEKLTEERHDDFDPPFTTLNVGLIGGGSAKNVIAGECRFTLEWRPIPGQKSEKLLDYLKEAIALEKKTDPEFICEINASRADSGFETPRSSELVKFLEKITGQNAGTVAFGTEAAQMINVGAEAVVLGPGDIRVAHQTGEFVPLTQLETCVDLLRQAIEHFCT